MFVYHPKLRLTKYQNTYTEYITRWRSKGEYIPYLVPIKIHSLPNIKYFEYKIGMQFTYTPFVIDQINYAT